MPALPSEEDELLELLSEVLQLTRHAVGRYRLRADEPLTSQQARRALKQRILHGGVLCDQPPQWLHPGAGGHTADYYLLIDDEWCLPVRCDDPRGEGRRMVAVTAMRRGYRPPDRPDTAARAWAQRRADAALLGELVVLSQTAVRRYSQFRQPAVSAHADLVQACLAGQLESDLPEWAWRVRSRDRGDLYLVCEDGALVLPLRVTEDGPGARLHATTCLWRDWQPTARQLGHAA